MWIHITPDLSKVTLGKKGHGVDVDVVGKEYSFVYRSLGVLVTLHVDDRKLKYDTWRVRVYDLPGGVWHEAFIVMDDDRAVAQRTTQHTLWAHEAPSAQTPTRP